MYHSSQEHHEGLIYKEEVYQLQGVIFEVYRELGCGFLESVYHECLMRELSIREIPFQSEPQLRLRYKGVPLDQFFKPDLVCYDKIIIELKSVSEMSRSHKAQLYNYLKASGLRLGLLVNFGHHPKVQIDRIIN